MKKRIALTLVLLLLASAACAEGPLSGGWTPAEDPTVTEPLKNLFAQGTAAVTGIGYVPVAYLGSQVVAGRNHAFLCQAVTAYPGSLEMPPAWKIVYLYQDLSGNVSILSVADFDFGSLCVY